MIRVKTDDLRLLMDYVNRENPESVAISQGDDKFSIKFEFLDEKNRECQVIVYLENRQMPPDLIKKMQLETRIKK